MVFGLGVRGVWSFQNATSTFRDLVGWTIGLAPITGRQMLVRQYVDNEKLLEAMPKRGIPSDSNEFYSWVNGDSVLYESSGGAVFLGSAGIPFVSADGTIISKSDWRTYIEKIDDSHVYVSMQKSKTETAVAFTGAGLTTLSASQFETAGTGFSFVFNIDDNKAAEAYTHMINGHIVPAQELAADRLETSVVHANDLTYLMTGRSFNMFFGVPFVYFSSSRGTSHQFTNVENHINGLQTTTDYGIYAREINNRLISRHKNLIRSFTAGIAKTRDAQTGKVVEEDVSATFLWQYEKDRTRVRDFNNAIQLLIQDTGLEQQTALRASDRNHLGYSRIKLEFTMDAAYVKQLMALSQTRSGFTTMGNQVMRNLESYLRVGDRYKLCNQQNESDRDRCQQGLRSETRRAFTRIQNNFQVMNRTYGTDSKAFAEAFAQVGRYMMTNQFTLQPFLQAAESCGGKLGYEVSGERISRVSSLSTWEHSTQACRF